MQIILPSEISSSYVKTLIKLEESLGNEKSLTLNWSKTTRIEASGMSILSVITDLAIESQTSLKHINLSKDLIKKFTHPIFSFSKFDQRLSSKDHFRETENSLNMCIDGGFSPYFSEYFAEKFRSLQDSVLFHVQLIMNELLQNATDHSGSERYYLYGQVKNDRLSFGVLDSGIGIPHKLAQKYHQPSDEEYINFSFKKEISTRRLRKGGYGLYHTFNITKNYEGSLVVLSLRGGIRRYFAQRKVVRLKLNNNLRGSWSFVEIKYGTNV